MPIAAMEAGVRENTNARAMEGNAWLKTLSIAAPFLAITDKNAEAEMSAWPKELSTVVTVYPARLERFACREDLSA
jgi:hypothetical protein